MWLLDRDNLFKISTEYRLDILQKNGIMAKGVEGN